MSLRLLLKYQDFFHSSRHLDTSLLYLGSFTPYHHGRVPTLRPIMKEVLSLRFTTTTTTGFGSCHGQSYDSETGSQKKGLNCREVSHKTSGQRFDETREVMWSSDNLTSINGNISRSNIFNYYCTEEIITRVNSLEKEMTFP